MIAFIILINLPLVACKDEGEAPPGPEGSVSTPAGTQVQDEESQGDSDSEEQDEYLQQIGDEVPHDVKTAPPLQDPKVLSSGGPEVLSAYPPEIDADGDGFVDRAITGHPEITVDNCPAVANPDQADRNGNGIGDLCE